MFCRGTVSLFPQTVGCIGSCRKHSSHFCYVLLGILLSKKQRACQQSVKQSLSMIEHFFSDVICFSKCKASPLIMSEQPALPCDWQGWREKTGRNISITACQLSYKYTSAWPLCVAVYIIYSQNILNVYVLIYQSFNICCSFLNKYLWVTVAWLCTAVLQQQCLGLQQEQRHGADGSPLAWLLKHVNQSPSYQHSKASSFNSQLPRRLCLRLISGLFLFITNSPICWLRVYLPQNR